MRGLSHFILLLLLFACWDWSPVHSGKASSSSWHAAREHASGDSRNRTYPVIAILAPFNTTFMFNAVLANAAVELATRTVAKMNLRPEIKNMVVLEPLDSKCTQSQYALYQAVEIYLHNTPSVLIGPICDEALGPVGRLAPFWGLPVITPGSVNLINRQEEFQTLTRIGHTQVTDFIKFFNQLFRLYKWSKVRLIYERNAKENIVPEYCHLFCAALIEGGRHQFIDWPKIFLKDYHDLHDEKIEELIDNRAVVVLCADADSVREIMIKAFDLNFINGEYVFFNIDLFSSSKALEMPWYRPNDTDSNNNKAKEAYRALMTITLRKPDTEAYKNFSNDVKKLAGNKGYIYNKDEDVNSFVGAFHDAVLLYALALNETLADGISLNNGSQITKRMWNRTFNGITGLVSIDPNGDRNADYSLMDLDTVTWKFKPVGHYNGMTMRYNPIPGEKIDWITKDNKPPSDTPRCGYDNSGCPGILTNWAIFLIAMSIAAVIASVMGYFFYRQARMQAELNAMNWMISWSEIETHEKRRKRSSNGGSKKSSSVYRGFFTRTISKDSRENQINSPLLERVTAVDNAHGMPMRSINNRKSKVENEDEVSIHSHNSLDSFAVIHTNNPSNNQIFARTGVFRGTVVALKPIILGRKMDLSREILMEVKKVKDLNNNHLARLIGICLESPHECIVTEYCQKGSLQDVLENDQINLDWMFKFSLIQDICRGMIYLHNNIGPHGNLKSSNCLVDSRFVLKITDFGLPHFRINSPNQELETHQLFRNKLWTAPELLRCSNNQALYPRMGTFKGDVYSFAIVCQEIIYRNGVFYLEDSPMDPTDIINRVTASEKPPFRPTLDTEHGCPQEVVDIVKGCWDEETNHRHDFHRIKIMMRKLNSAGDSGEILDNLLSRMEQYANNLEGLVAQRTEQYYEEKKKAEDLLYSMLPKSVAGQLIRGEPVTAESYDNVTVYFSDICGFTTLSAQSTAMQVISLLNDLYTLFDSIIENYDAYKVETIGDAYMVVSGLPQRNGDLHAREVARMSLAFLASIRRFRIAHKPETQLKLRIGVNSGPVCAGVVGRKMPRYCLFGDTVNTASRMESSGEPLKIHMSQATKSVLDTFGTFITKERGQIELKGKGKVQSYWLLGEHSEKMTQFL